MSEHQAIKDVFDRFDTDGNGVIDAYEFGSLCKTLDPNMTEEAIESGLDAADTNGDGVIDWGNNRRCVLRNQTGAQEQKDGDDLDDGFHWGSPREPAWSSGNGKRWANAQGLGASVKAALRPPGCREAGNRACPPIRGPSLMAIYAHDTRRASRLAKAETSNSR